MQGFSSSFLIFFYQIALGGMFALAGTPFHEIERGFYKSTAGVLYFIALLGFFGKCVFYLQAFGQPVSLALGFEIFFHSAFVTAFTGYMISLWGERQVFRARSFAATVLTGLAGLLCTTASFSSAPLLSVETVIYPVAFFLSSLLLGGVTVGMLIGHWYLIDTGQSLEPFIRIYKFFIYALFAQCLFYLVAGPLLYWTGSTFSITALERLWQRHSTLLITRLMAGQAAPLVLSWMIWRTLKIPHTMAATGLFYIALLGVFVGEILGRQILALTALPF